MDNEVGVPHQKSKFRQYLPQILAVMVKNILLLAYGMTIGYPTILIPAVDQDSVNSDDNDLLLTKEQISWIGSINLIAFPIGCIFSGSFTQFFGRKRAMQMIVFPMIISWKLFYFANKVEMLYAALILFGINGGLMEAPVITYVAEVTEPSIRGALSGTGSLFIIIGITVQFLLGTMMKWRQIALVSMAFPVVAFILLFFVPESPYFLLLKNQFEAAQKSLAWLRGWTTPDDIMEEYQLLHDGIIEKPTQRNRKPNRFAWTNKIKAFTHRSFTIPFFLVSFSFFVGHFAGMTTLQTYAVKIFHTLKAPMDKYYATLLLGITETTGAIICITLIHYTGKRPLAFISTIGCGICFFFTATYAFYLPDTITELGTSNSTVPSLNGSNSTSINGSDLVLINSVDASEEEKSKYAWIPLTLLLGSALLSHSGIRSLPWILIGEVFKSELRAAGAGFASAMGCIFGFLANKLFLQMITSFTLPGTFWIYSGVAFIGTAILYRILPETEGHTLLEIEDHFAGRRKLKNKKKLKKNEYNQCPLVVLKTVTNCEFESVNLDEIREVRDVDTYHDGKVGEKNTVWLEKIKFEKIEDGPNEGQNLICDNHVTRL